MDISIGLINSTLSEVKPFIELVKIEFNKGAIQQYAQYIPTLYYYKGQLALILKGCTKAVSTQNCIQEVNKLLNDIVLIENTFLINPVVIHPIIMHPNN